MPRVSRSDAALVIAALVGSPALCAAVMDEVALGDVVFVTCLLLVLLAGVRAAVRAWVRASVQHRAAEASARTSPSDAALQVVREESERMAADIRGLLRSSFDDMAAHVARAHEDAPPDPAGVASLRAVQQLGRSATTELRRMLGLLRSTEEAEATAPASSPDTAAADRARLPGAGSVTLAVLLAGELVLSVVADPATVWSGETVVRLGLTLVAALLFLAPLDVAVATACTAAVVVLGMVVDAPVISGLWMVAALGVLAWRSLARPARDPWGYLALVVLVVAVEVSQRANDPDNVFIVTIVLTAGVLTGALTRVGEALHRRARARAARSEELVAETTERAVRHARLEVARELHDALSGTVGVVVTQAGAAEVRWVTDPDRARAALDVVTAAVAGARRELDAMSSVGEPLPRTPLALDDVPDLVARVRAAGIDAHLRLDRGADGAVPPKIGAAAYRIVQECLTNVARHAPGARADVRIRLSGQTLTVVVEDDGPGAEVGGADGYGLTGLRERVTGFGGAVSIDVVTHEGGSRGWRVAARLPVEAEVAAP